MANYFYCFFYYRTNRPSTSQQSESPHLSRRNSGTSTTDGITAATAVAGGVAASQELPYMTPPIAATAQLNFSGDSQDSSSKFKLLFV